jgi:hypothetical protein
MKRDDVIDTLRAHQRELNELGVQRVAVFGSVARMARGPILIWSWRSPTRRGIRCSMWCGCSGR